MVLYYIPAYGAFNAAFGLPVIWSMCIADPLLGECRRAQFSRAEQWFLSIFVLSLLWLTAAYLLDTPRWTAAIMPSLITAAEHLPVPKVDDNFVMLFLPTLVISLLHFG